LNLEVSNGAIGIMIYHVCKHIYNTNLYGDSYYFRI